MKKVLSKRINKEYWLSSIEVDDYELDGLPIFTPKDVQEIKVFKPNDDELLKIWIKKSFEKTNVATVLTDLRYQVERERHEDQYKRPGKKISPAAQLALDEIKRVLGNAQSA